MAEYTTLARPYATAIYMRAKETDSVEQWANQLAFLKDVLHHEVIQRAAANPKAERNEFGRHFLDLCHTHVTAEGMNFVRLLINNNRLSLIRYIEDQFKKNRAEDEGYIDVCVKTAYTLSKEETSRLEATLERVLGRKPRLDISVDKELIGGVCIRAGDRVIDASIRGQLESLEKRL